MRLFFSGLKLLKTRINLMQRCINLMRSPDYALYLLKKSHQSDAVAHQFGVNYYKSLFYRELQRIRLMQFKGKHK